jgi:hypothetical protein
MKQTNKQVVLSEEKNKILFKITATLNVRQVKKKIHVFCLTLTLEWPWL